MTAEVGPADEAQARDQRRNLYGAEVVVPRSRLGYARRAVRSQPETEGRPMEFNYKLEHEDGTAADPPTFRSLPGTSWNAGDVLHLGSERSLRVVGKRLVENRLTRCPA
jgi:hypothetical protein